MNTKKLFSLIPGLLVCAPLIAAEPVSVEFRPRTPEQMSAFYEARGFPRPMIELLAKQCFITVRIRNSGDRIIWLDLARWRFSSAGEPLQRYHRNYWKPLWTRMQVPLAKQSTFRWTLLPEQLDYQPDETEGGNIILPRVNTPITLEATFATGPDKSGTPIHYRNDKLKCAYDTP